MDQLQREREKLLQERESWQIKNNELHAKELEALKKQMENEQTELLKEREVWQKEMDRMHRIEMDKIMHEKDNLLKERETIEYEKFDFKASLKQSHIEVKDLKFLQELEDLLREKDMQ